MPSQAKIYERRPAGKNEPIWSALESGADIRRAVAVWKKKLLTGSLKSGKVNWHPDQAMWSYFSYTRAAPHQRKSGKHWNAFGLIAQENFRDNMAVEINPPADGIDTNVQGMVATDQKGRVWILHGGRIRVGRKIISGELFDKSFEGKRVVVRFSDNSVFRYHPVACIDESDGTVQASTAKFVRKCAKARNAHEIGRAAAKHLANIEAKERGLFPEFDGTYDIGARGATHGERRHGRIWKALKREAKARGLPVANKRVSRFGPDLYCDDGHTKILFEIKTSADPASIYEAFGQLHAYDDWLGGKFEKVLVVPLPLHEKFESILKKFQIKVLPFQYSKRTVVFDKHSMPSLNQVSHARSRHAG